MTSLARAADVAEGRRSGRARSALRGARTLVVWALAGAGLALALTMLVPLAFGGRPLTVMSGSMEPTIMTGDVVVALPIAPLEARPGDIVSFNDPNRSGVLVTHRVRSLRRAGAKVNFVTKGDANNSVEKWSVAANDDIARTVLRLPRLGRAMTFAKTRTGLLVLVLVPLALLAVLEVYSIWRSDEDQGVEA
jgi:signal peptidase